MNGDLEKKEYTHEDIESIGRELLGQMGVACDEMAIREEDGRLTFSIYTQDSGALIGPQGSHLSALTHIFRSILSRKYHTSTHFFVDVNDYHKKNIESVKQKALIIAERVRNFQTDTELEPMTAFERRFIHALFANDEELSTESRGEGPDRRIIIRYSKHK